MLFYIILCLLEILFFSPWHEHEILATGCWNRQHRNSIPDGSHFLIAPENNTQGGREISFSLFLFFQNQISVFFFCAITFATWLHTVKSSLGLPSHFECKDNHPHEELPPGIAFEIWMWKLAGREHHSEAKPARTSNSNASPIGECEDFWNDWSCR